MRMKNVLVGFVARIPGKKQCLMRIFYSLLTYSPQLFSMAHCPLSINYFFSSLKQNDLLFVYLYTWTMRST